MSAGLGSRRPRSAITVAQSCAHRHGSGELAVRRVRDGLGGLSGGLPCIASASPRDSASPRPTPVVLSRSPSRWNGRKSAVSADPLPHRALGSLADLVVIRRVHPTHPGPGAGGGQRTSLPSSEAPAAIAAGLCAPDSRPTILPNVRGSENENQQQIDLHQGWSTGSVSQTGGAEFAL